MVIHCIKRDKKSFHFDTFISEAWGWRICGAVLSFIVRTEEQRKINRLYEKGRYLCANHFIPKKENGKKKMKIWRATEEKEEEINA